MGPCQGGFCAYRAAAILHEVAGVGAAEATQALASFAQERWKGQRPLLWGQSLRQALLDEHIYRAILGLDRLPSIGQPHAVAFDEAGSDADRATPARIPADANDRDVANHG
jgi:glycerol-3-phosphate dehydrogenase